MSVVVGVLPGGRIRTTFGCDSEAIDRVITSRERGVEDNEARIEVAQVDAESGIRR